MKHKSKPIYTGDKKYKTYNDNGIVTVYRNEIMWKTTSETAGDGYLLSMIQEVEILKEQRDELLAALKNLLDPENDTDKSYSDAYKAIDSIEASE